MRHSNTVLPRFEHRSSWREAAGLALGDMLATRPAHHLDWLSRWTVVAQSQLFPKQHACITHVGTYVGNGFVAEAQSDKAVRGRVGVVLTRLEDFVAGCAEVRVRRDELLTDVQRRLLVACVCTHVGRPYSRIRAADLFLELMLDRWRLNVVGSHNDPRVATSIWGIVCSDVFAIAYAEATLRAAAPDARYLVCPAALSASRRFVDVRLSV